jgi:hypothetical protein
MLGAKSGITSKNDRNGLKPSSLDTSINSTGSCLNDWEKNTTPNPLAIPHRTKEKELPVQPSQWNHSKTGTTKACLGIRMIKRAAPIKNAFKRKEYLANTNPAKAETKVAKRAWVVAIVTDCHKLPVKSTNLLSSNIPYACPSNCSGSNWEGW